MRYLPAVITLFLMLAPAHAQDAKQQRIDNAISAAERICLVGKRYKFSADASGSVTITKILPSGKAQVLIDNAEGRGGQFFDNEIVRRGVDADIRECMKDQWPIVLRQIEAAGPQRKIVKVCYGEGGGPSCKNSGSYVYNCQTLSNIGGGAPTTYAYLKKTFCGEEPGNVVNTYNVGGGHCGWTEFTITCNP